MQRSQRLRTDAQFQRVRAAGRSWSHRLLVLAAALGASPGGPSRVGITAGKRVGGAVVRNRARRRVSEIVRIRYARLAPGWDLVFIVRQPAADASFDGLAGAVDDLLGRAGVLRTEASCTGSRSA